MRSPWDPAGDTPFGNLPRSRFLDVTKITRSLRIVGPGTRGEGVLWEFLGGDVPLGPWNP